MDDIIKTLYIGLCDPNTQADNVYLWYDRFVGYLVMPSPINGYLQKQINGGFEYYKDKNR